MTSDPRRPRGRPGAPRRDEQNLPVRVAVVSRSAVVRAGLVQLVAQLGSGAVVTAAVSIDGRLSGHDVVVYDLGAIVDDDRALRDLRSLVRSSSRVIGLVYDLGQLTEATSVATGAPLITLAVTPEEFATTLRAVTRADGSVDGARRLPGDLTAQEFRVVELIGAGMTNEGIAAKLLLSPNTVKNYIRAAYRKIGATDRATAILWALRHGLAGGPDRR